MKKTTRVIEYEYDKDGVLIKLTETITEKIVDTGIIPPSSPSVVDRVPLPFKPYVGDVWNQPNSGGKIYTNTDGEPLRVTYDEQV